jgi:Domain of unknown function (DUF4920)
VIRNIIFSTFLLAAFGNAEAKNYGAKMPKGEAVDIALAVNNIADYAGKPGKFKGRITQVCQAKGCWVMIESDGKAARISSNDKIFVPKDSKGTAVVFGEIKQVALKPAEAKHLAEDAGKTAPVESNEIQIIASSISIKK